MDDTNGALRALLDRDQGLPGRFFTDEAIFRLERQAVFENGWMCIGLSSDAAVKGQLFPVVVLGWPLLMVHDGAMLRVFHNVCSHRGATLIEAAVLRTVRIVCPYHSWTYKLDGELIATPHLAGAGQHACPAFDREKLGLRAVRCAEWAGHVFVNLSGTAPPFDEWIQPVAQRFTTIDWRALRRDAALSRELQVAANWKIVIENFAESYHLPWVHRTLNAVNPMELHYQILGGHSYVGQGGTGYQGEPAAEATLPSMPGLADASRYESLAVLPNLILGPLPDMTFSIIVLPQSAECTRERLEFFFVGDTALQDSFARVRQNSADFVADINVEDIEIVERVQRGRHSPAFVGGQFAPAQEATSLQFQKTIAARILSGGVGELEHIVPLPTCDVAHPDASQPL